jgi:hypothetical protein
MAYVFCAVRVQGLQKGKIRLFELVEFETPACQIMSLGVAELKEM